jgi:hypothetical protein
LQKIKEIILRDSKEDS